jgi:hypothetical protein
MSCIPNPFKIKWKHYFPPSGVQRFKVYRSGLPCLNIPGSFSIFLLTPKIVPLTILPITVNPKPRNPLALNPG